MSPKGVGETGIWSVIVKKSQGQTARNSKIPSERRLKVNKTKAILLLLGVMEGSWCVCVCV